MLELKLNHVSKTDPGEIAVFFFANIILYIRCADGEMHYDSKLVHVYALEYRIPKLLCGIAHKYWKCTVDEFGG